ncbi:FAD-binding protein [Saccharicrinis aurantiacus]|uniref:FAD-binding protein n=1 Tax=Saccharicrinis aurantiacus TaxID=1849719 RepID=UPI00248F6C54|nr:FAD-binding protein [Saccharicrinis aurantiacus]
MGNNINRREFISLTGGFAGMAALASMGISGWGDNEAEVTVDEIESKQHSCDVLVIGGGMAGLFAAIKAHDAGAKVLFVSKGRLGSSGQTPFAKGIFEYDPKNAKLTIDEFVEKVSLSAIGTNNRVYTRQLAEHSKARVDELREWGFFESPLYNKSFSKPINERQIPLMERITITNLIKENGKIAGAAGFSIDEKEVHFFNAKSVILCTGAGGFKPNGFPICDLTHDGTIMAYNIGAKVTGKEWNDGHPAKEKNAAASFDGWGDMFLQKPSTTDINIRHDLGVDMNYQAYVGGGGSMRMGPQGPNGGASVKGGPQRPAGLDNQMPGGQGSKPEGGKRPPKGKEGGAPPGMSGGVVGGSSAGMSIHKSEGLVPINDKCESNIPGLYAAGDALGSHMTGGIYTQIGSSLAGSAVQGAVAGEAAAEYSGKTEIQKLSKSKINTIQSEIFAPLKRESGYSPAWVTQTLQGIMIPNFVLYVKKESMMRAALAYVVELRESHLPYLRAKDLHELRLVHETRNMIITAEMKLKASLMRKESRCSHYRMDYPEIDHENWDAWINIFKGDNGEMLFEKQAFDSWS